jgi:hypothetical protein
VKKKRKKDMEKLQQMLRKEGPASGIWPFLRTHGSQVRV